MNFPRIVSAASRRARYITESASNVPSRASTRFFKSKNENEASISAEEKLAAEIKRDEEVKDRMAELYMQEMQYQKNVWGSRLK